MIASFPMSRSDEGREHPDGKFRPHWKSVKNFEPFCVKSGRLSERSEFLPLSKKVQNLALEVQSALFLFSSFSFWCQKEKEH